jgi:cytochrome c2
MTALPLRGAGLVCAAAVLLAAGPARADGDAVRGEKRFADCAACHSVESGVNGIGPSLNGVFGRRAGDLAGYRYSPALKRSGITWTPETIETFIADPQKVVPANRMPYAGMQNPTDRADLIAYLLQTTKP